MDPGPDVAIAVDNVRYRYRRGGREALAGVTLAVRRGSCFGLLGPNGAGKSTLIGLMTGALSLQDGQIVVSGRDARRDPRGVRAAGAIAPQDLAFYPALTGRENLAFFAGVMGLTGAVRDARIAEAVSACQLDSVADQPAETYSGGLKRRLNLAIALVGAPRILYLDEPTVGIDAQSRALIVEAIDALRATGVTIIYTSHYMEEVETLCDTIAIIDDGVLVALDNVDVLLRRSAGRRLSITLESPLPAEIRATIAGDWASETEFWTMAESAGAIEALLARLRAAGGQVATLDYGAARLERVYLDLLARRGRA